MTEELASDMLAVLGPNGDAPSAASSGDAPRPAASSDAPRPGVETQPAGADTPRDPVSLVLNADGVVFVIVWLLIVAAVLVWFVGALKFFQLRRWARAEDRFEIDAARAEDPDHLFDIAKHHDEAPGARVALALEKRRGQPRVLESVAKRAIVEEQKHASALLSFLASIGSAAPFIGLFGTVWGIMEAFLNIERMKSVSLTTVSGPIGHALIATAIGLVAAIPAVVIYNSLSKRLDDLMSEIESSADGWVALVQHAPAQTHAVRAAKPATAPMPRVEHSARQFPGA